MFFSASECSVRRKVPHDLQSIWLFDFKRSETRIMFLKLQFPASFHRLHLKSYIRYLVPDACMSRGMAHSLFECSPSSNLRQASPPLLSTILDTSTSTRGFLWPTEYVDVLPRTPWDEHPLLEAVAPPPPSTALDARMLPRSSPYSIACLDVLPQVLWDMHPSVEVLDLSPPSIVPDYCMSPWGIPLASKVSVCLTPSTLRLESCAWSHSFSTFFHHPWQQYVITRFPMALFKVDIPLSI